MSGDLSPRQWQQVVTRPTPTTVVWEFFPSNVVALSDHREHPFYVPPTAIPVFVADQDERDVLDHLAEQQLDTARAIRMPVEKRVRYIRAAAVALGAS